MNSIAFVPASRALFIADSASESSSGMQHNTLLQQLRAQGWPTQARLLLPGTELAFRHASGVMIELIDALPLLVGPDAEPALAGNRELTALSKLLRLALSVTERGQAWPKLSRLGTGTRYLARWKAALSRGEKFDVAKLSHELRLLLAELPNTVLSSDRWQSAVTGHRVAYLLLDATVDLLVREGCRRGAQVRLAGCAASMWEQRLVAALSGDKALLLASTPSDEAFGQFAEQTNAWSRSALDGAVRPLLPSPESWQATESLLQVSARMLRQASLLSTVILAGQPAPRMLPTAAWKLESTHEPRKPAQLPRKLLDEALQLLRDSKPRSPEEYRAA